MLQKKERVKTGLDVMQRDGFSALRNAKVALLGHPASINSNYEHLYDLMVSHEINIVRLFGPEHGFFGSAQDMESVNDTVLTSNKIPVTSLYGTNRKSLLLDPTLLNEVDVLICDLQDIGSRYYTFIYTVAFALSACAKTKTKCIVLDRPNPIGGSRVEGNIVKAPFHSFVGEYPLAIQHGMTIGELAQYFKEVDCLDVDLEVIWMENWKRSQHFDETNLGWVLPSPNMPLIDTARLYPGLCLIEGTNLSEGRGTTRPFEFVGAPYINDPVEFAKQASKNISGVFLRPCWFKPMFQKHANEMCGGLQIHITDMAKLEPIRLGISIISSAKTFEGFSWRTEPYEFVSDRLAIDLLFGDDKPRQMIDKLESVDKIVDYLNQDIPYFMDLRSKFLNPNYED